MVFAYYFAWMSSASGCMRASDHNIMKFSMQIHCFFTLFALDLFITWRGRFPMVIDRGVQEWVPPFASHVPSRYNIIGKTTAPLSADRNIGLFDVKSPKIWTKMTSGASSCVDSHQNPVFSSPKTLLSPVPRMSGTSIKPSCKVSSSKIETACITMSKCRTCS